MQLQDLISESSHFDIWRYSQWLQPVANYLRISDRRSALTPLQKLSEKLWIKHEDQHPIGSHKGRSLAYQLSLLQQAGRKKLVLSSSGNAAIACKQLTYSKETVVLVSPTIDQGKLAELVAVSGGAKVVMTTQARALAHYLVAKHGYSDLRPSQNESAIMGLMTLGFEIAEQVVDLDNSYSIFSPTTSGANILGMGRAFLALQQAGLLQTIPQVFPVVLQDYHGGTMSASRMAELQDLARVSGGKIIEQPVITNSALGTSFEGATAYQAYLDHQDEVNRAIVVFTGRQWPQPQKPIIMPIVHNVAELLATITV